MWMAIGLMLVVSFFGAGTTVLAGHAHAQAPADHHVAATGERDHLAAVDHDHVGPAAMPSPPDVFADAPASRLRTALPILGLIFATGLLWMFLPQENTRVGRDPPRGSPIVSPGRDVLTRLCISRR